MFNRNCIKFSCVGIPYERIQYLEALGVKVWLTHDIHEEEDGSYTATCRVTPDQYHYAAGLLQGIAGTHVLEPQGVKPIQPRTRWGVTNRSAGGLLTTAGRVMASVCGIDAKTPPISAKPARAKKGRKASARPAKRNKAAGKPNIARRLWDSLGDE